MVVKQILTRYDLLFHSSEDSPFSYQISLIQNGEHILRLLHAIWAHWKNIVHKEHLAAEQITNTSYKWETYVSTRQWFLSCEKHHWVLRVVKQHLPGLLVIGYHLRKLHVARHLLHGLRAVGTNHSSHQSNPSYTKRPRWKNGKGCFPN